jgi:signal peptidase I
VTDSSPTTVSSSHEEKKESLPVWQESLLLLAIALVLAIGIKYFFVQAF